MCQIVGAGFSLQVKHGLLEASVANLTLRTMNSNRRSVELLCVKKRDCSHFSVTDCALVA